MNRSTLALVSILILGVLFTAVEARRSGGCKKPECVELDEKWIEERGDAYWWAPLGSKLERAKPGDEDEEGVEGSGAKKRCWSALVKSPVGAVPIPMDCSYDAVKEQTCGLKTKGSAVHKFVRYFGEFTATLTDDKTYVVAFGCLLGKNDYWVAMSINKKFDDETHNLILDHIETMGFKKNNLKSDRDLVSIEKVKMVKCRKGHKSDSTGLPGEPEKKR